MLLPINTKTILFLIISLLGVGCASKKIKVYDKTPEEITKIDNKFERFTSLMIGHFSNKTQVDTSTTNTTEQEFVNYQILKNRTGEKMDIIYLVCKIESG